MDTTILKNKMIKEIQDAKDFEEIKYIINKYYFSALIASELIKIFNRVEK